jgi:hypothetical protein
MLTAVHECTTRLRGVDDPESDCTDGCSHDAADACAHEVADTEAGVESVLIADRIARG